VSLQLSAGTCQQRNSTLAKMWDRLQSASDGWKPAAEKGKVSRPAKRLKVEEIPAVIEEERA
jgi:hypothetical protein